MRALGPVALTSLWSFSAGWLRRTNEGDNGLPPDAVVGVWWASSWAGRSAYPSSAATQQPSVSAWTHSPLEIGCVAVPWPVLATHVVLEVLSLALVWAGTRLIEGPLPSESRAETPAEGSYASSVEGAA